MDEELIIRKKYLKDALWEASKGRVEEAYAALCRVVGSATPVDNRELEQEPVAWLFEYPDGDYEFVKGNNMPLEWKKNATPLYTKEEK